MSGDIGGKCLFRLRAGVPDSTGSNYTWDTPIVSSEIFLTKDNTYHTFGYVLQRPAEGDPVATKRVETATLDSVPPSDLTKFVLQADIGKFRTSAKRAAVALVMQNATASVVAL